MRRSGSRARRRALFIASGNPASAALRYQTIASERSTLTPLPNSSFFARFTIAIARVATGGAEASVFTADSSKSFQARRVAGATADGSVHLAAKVRAVPDKGAANVALERLVGDSLGLPKSAVRVVSGTTSRLKTVRLSGDPALLVPVVETAIAKAALAREASRS